MPDIVVEPVGPDEHAVLIDWLDDAALAGIDVTQVQTIEDAYERYFDHVASQDEVDREDPSPALGMVGFALGQWLSTTTVLEWRVITEDGNRDLGLSLPDESAIIFPSDRVADAWNARERTWLTAWAQDLRAQLEALA